MRSFRELVVLHGFVAGRGRVKLRLRRECHVRAHGRIRVARAATLSDDLHHTARDAAAGADLGVGWSRAAGAGSGRASVGNAGTSAGCQGRPAGCCGQGPVGRAAVGCMVRPGAALLGAVGVFRAGSTTFGVWAHVAGCAAGFGAHAAANPTSSSNQSRAILVTGMACSFAAAVMPASIRHQNDASTPTSVL